MSDAPETVVKLVTPSRSAGAAAVAVLIGLYMIGVARAGKAAELLDDLKTDRVFVLWIIALLVVFAISRAPRFTGIADALIFISLLALALKSIDTIKTQWSEFFNYIRSGG